MINHEYSHLTIVNPIAGKNKYKEVVKTIKKYFDEHQIDAKIIYTTYEGHAKEIVLNLDKNKIHRVYVVGGDGTFNEAVNGVTSKNVELVNIPTGSGNDFNKSITKERDPEKIFVDSFHKEARLVDTLTVNGIKCVNVASVGLDADVAHNVTKFKKIPLISGTLAYFLSIFYTILKYKSYEMKIVIDSKLYTKKLMLMAFGNGKYYGSGMKALPMAIVDDGIIDIFSVEKMTRRRIISLLSKFRKGNHLEVEGISFEKGKNINVKANELLNINIDGKTIKDTEVNIVINPKDIKIV